MQCVYDCSVGSVAKIVKFVITFGQLSSVYCEMLSNVRWMKNLSIVSVKSCETKLQYVDVK